MVPMISPNGTPGDIPFEKLNDAKAAGFKPAVTMKAKDGTLGYVPADRYQEAAKSGMEIVPLKEQDTQHPGFWHQLFSDIGNIRPASVSPYPGMDLEAKQNIAQSAVQADAGSKAAGHGALYRTGAALAGAAGANVPGMEQSAAEGDPEGVLGHAAAVPAVLGTTMAAGEVLPKIAEQIPEEATATRAAKTTGKVLANQSLYQPLKAISKLQDYWEAASPQGELLAATKKAISEGRAAKIPTRISASLQEAQAAETPSLIPEPRPSFSGEDAGYMASVPRKQLSSLAQTGKPGAGMQLQQLGKPVLYIPKEADFPVPQDIGEVKTIKQAIDDPAIKTKILANLQKNGMSIREANARIAAYSAALSNAAKSKPDDQ